MYSNVCVSDETSAEISATTLQQRFEKKFPTASEDAIDLLINCLTYDPKVRLAPLSGMTHPYCVQFHDDLGVTSAEMAVGSTPIHAVGKDFFDGVSKEEYMDSVSDNTKLSTNQYRTMLYGICNANANVRSIGKKESGAR